MDGGYSAWWFVIRSTAPADIADAVRTTVRAAAEVTLLSNPPPTARKEDGRFNQTGSKWWRWCLRAPGRVTGTAHVSAMAPRAVPGHGNRQPKPPPPYMIRFTVCVGTYNHANPLGCPTVCSRFEKAARTVWLQSGRAGSTQRCSMRCCQGGQRTPTEMMPGKQASCPSGARRACHRRPHELVALG